MRAALLRAYGGPEALEIAELPTPVAGPGQLLLRVRASSVNPVDWKLGSGKTRPFVRARFPHVVGYDVAGEVLALGPGVTGYTVGQRVHARLESGGAGACAEQTLAGVKVTAPMPEGMDFATAAALPLAGMTALQALRDRARLAMQGSKERVLVVGASGGVGHLGVQLARASGAHVVGVCSGANAELVRSLGAHEVLDYKQPDPYRGQAPFDVVLDCVAGDFGAWSHLLTPKGRYVSCLPGPGVVFRQLANPFCKRSAHAVLLSPNRADLEALDAYFAEGKLRAVLDKRFPFEQTREAWERSISGRAVGKIVIDVAPE